MQDGKEAPAKTMDESEMPEGPEGPVVPLTDDNSTSDHLPHERYGLITPIRLIALTCFAYTTGAVLGLSLGGKSAALRFRAENSHRLPSSQKGWYLYHRAKNLYVARASVPEGNRMGLKVAPWVFSFLAVEEAVDRIRTPEFVPRGGEQWREDEAAGSGGASMESGERNQDFLSTTVAGLGVAGGFSLWCE